MEFMRHLEKLTDFTILGIGTNCYEDLLTPSPKLHGIIGVRVSYDGSRGVHKICSRSEQVC